MNTQSAYTQPIMVAQGNDLHYIEPHRLIMLSRTDGMTEVYYIDMSRYVIDKLRTSRDLCKFVPELPSYFFEVNRSQIVNLHYVTKLGSDLKLGLKCAGLPEVRVARKPAPDFKRAMLRVYPEGQYHFIIAFVMQLLLRLVNRGTMN